MTTSLLVLIPIALLVLISGFCFVGCVLDTSGYGIDYGTYSEDDILKNPNCIAYWQLNEPAGNLAIDAGGKAKNDPHNGIYRSKTSDPDLFPYPGYVVNPSKPVTTAAAPGDLVLGAANIVVGDTEPPHDLKTPLWRTSMQTDGGFVQVEANATCNPPVFTFECWVFPEWEAADPPATRQVFDSRDSNTAISGFGLRIDDAGNWEAQIGHTNTMAFLEVSGGKVALKQRSYVVMTFDGSNVAVFVDGVQTSAPTSIPAGATFTPNTTQPLLIGASSPYLTPRTPGATEPPPLFPILPFKGRIQCVAIYDAVLSNTTIMNHFQHGQGNLVE